MVALAVAELFGVGPDQALPRLREVTSVAGRYTQLDRDGRRLRLLLAKNPAGWLEAFDVLAPGAGAGAAGGQRAGARRQGHVLAVGRGLPGAARPAGAGGR